MPVLCLFLLLCGLPLLMGKAIAQPSGPLCAHDSNAKAICLAQPAQRVISLSPGGTEQLYAAGAGHQVIATVDYSDYPSEAARLPRVGSSSQLDVERIAALNPDLVVAWTSGNAPAQLHQLEALGITVIRLDPQRIDDVATTLVTLGRLTGHQHEAEQASHEFLQGMAALRTRFAGKSRVRTFYEVWNQPLMTINRHQLISQVISLCGGTNIYGELPALVPHVSTEAVLVANPDIIVSGGPGQYDSRWLATWRKWPELNAVRYQALYFIPPDLIQQPTPRLLQGAQRLCQYIDKTRQQMIRAS